MPSADDPPASRQRWVSFDEARMLLRMSEGALRRAIKAGIVKAERRRRNPDSPTDLREVLDVLIAEPPAPATPIEPPQTPPSATEPPVDAARLMDKLDERDATIAALYAENAALRERVGRAEERATDLTARLAETQATLAHERVVNEGIAAERRRTWLDRLLGRRPQS